MKLQVTPSFLQSETPNDSQGRVQAQNNQNWQTQPPEVRKKILHHKETLNRLLHCKRIIRMKSLLASKGQNGLRAEDQQTHSTASLEVLALASQLPPILNKTLTSASDLRTSKLPYFPTHKNPSMEILNPRQRSSSNGPAPLRGPQGGVQQTKSKFKKEQEANSGRFQAPSKQPGVLGEESSACSVESFIEEEPTFVEVCPRVCEFTISPRLSTKPELISISTQTSEDLSSQEARPLLNQKLPDLGLAALAHELMYDTSLPFPAFPPHADQRLIQLDKPLTSMEGKQGGITGPALPLQSQPLDSEMKPSSSLKTISLSTAPPPSSPKIKLTNDKEGYQDQNELKGFYQPCPIESMSSGQDAAKRDYFSGRWPHKAKAAPESLIPLNLTKMVTFKKSTGKTNDSKKKVTFQAQALKQNPSLKDLIDSSFQTFSSSSSELAEQMPVVQPLGTLELPSETMRKLKLNSSKSQPQQRVQLKQAELGGRDQPQLDLDQGKASNQSLNAPAVDQSILKEGDEMALERKQSSLLEPPTQKKPGRKNSIIGGMKGDSPRLKRRETIADKIKISSKKHLDERLSRKIEFQEKLKTKWKLKKL